MRLRELLVAANIPCASQSPALDREVMQLSTNSWDCQPGTLFIGMPGTRVDGGNFWPSAIAAGAIAAIVSPQAKQPDSDDPSLIIPVEQIEQVCGQLATIFYDYPAQKLALVGVTGTNGKTTTTHLIEYLVQAAHQAPALFGTLYSRWPSYEVIATHTTPFAVTLQGQLAAAVQAGVKVGVMEVSSHSLAQHRTWGCEFTAAVFTNLTQDHLDYHKDLEDYFAAKSLLFQEHYLKGRAIINGDDLYGRRLLKQFGPGLAWSYRTTGEADLWASDLHYRADGVSGIMHTPQGTAPFNSPLVGQFNVENLLAAIGVGLHLGLDLSGMLASLPKFSGVPGRMQQVKVSPGQDISVIVDYAHTPDSLENLLKAARPFISGKMICVFGCGGDRDRTKRPQMGKIAATLADQVIVTSDNPRTEDPERILEDILTGIDPNVNPRVEADRHQAILEAILQAKAGDGVVIAGKGHEDYQILGTEKIHFDDREEATAALNQRLGQFGKG